MKVLWLTTSSNNTVVVMSSLEYLEKHEVKKFAYDQKWHEQVSLAVQSNSDVKTQLQAGQFHLPPERVGMDRQMIQTAKEFSPDVILYTSAWEGDFVPKHETFAELKSIAPLVHICWDSGDPPWWPQLREFEEKGLFSLTVGIDGARAWPGGSIWPLAYQGDPGDWKIKNALSLLTHHDPINFRRVTQPFGIRPYPVGYAGNAGGWIRGWLVQQMNQHHTDIFAYRARDNHPLSYELYCTFLKHCRTVISVPFTGSNATTHVKGRVVEAGYAGACLLEWKNSATASWFTPRADYWEYESVEECREMAQFLAKHPKLCEEMGRNLNHRVTTEHSPEKFWAQVFERI